MVRARQFDNASHNFSSAIGKVEIVIEHEKRSRLPGKSTSLYRHCVWAAQPDQAVQSRAS